MHRATGPYCTVEKKIYFRKTLKFMLKFTLFVEFKLSRQAPLGGKRMCTSAAELGLTESG